MPPWIGDDLVDIVWWLAVLIAGANLIATACLFVLSRRERSRTRRATPGPVPEGLLFVFMVPACDEEAVIADSIARLDAVQGVERLIMVIDDGSTDRTGAILRRLAAGRDDLIAVTRTAPEARQGKGAALNDAWRRLHTRLDRTGRDRDQVIVCVVDADGRLEAGAPRVVASQFADPRVGGVQIAVEMYNRDVNLLTRLQHVEFAAFGELFEQGRNRLDTVGLGGNGQFTRLSALDAVAAELGPWRDMLTEDMDLGIRLHLAGWRVVWDGRVAVAQQAIPQVGRLVRQRTRWSQGSEQNWIWLPSIVHDRQMRVSARADLSLWLGIPFMISAMAVALVVFFANLVHLVVSTAGAFPGLIDAPGWRLAASYVLAFGVELLGGYAYWAADHRRGLWASVGYAHVMAFYAWLWMGACLTASYREARGTAGWVKTAREPVLEAQRAA